MTQEEEKKGSFENLSFDSIECSHSVLGRVLWQEKKIWTLLVIFITIGIIALLAYNRLFEEIPIVIASPVTYYLYLSNKTHGKFMRELAKKNGLKYQKSMPIKEVLGNLFKVGWGRKINQIIKGEHKGYKTRLFYYNYTVGFGRYSATYHFTVMETFLGEIKAPYMLLQYGKRYGAKEKGEIKITLEEEFKNTFDLYVEDGYGIEAMQIFRKDFLLFLCEEGCDFSIELKENRIYVYCKDKITKKKDLQELCETSKQTLLRIRPLLKRLENDFNVLQEHYNK